MKKYIILTFAAILFNTGTHARAFLACINGQSYIFSEIGTGIFVGSVAGGCAFGPWIIELRIDDYMEQSDDDALAELLNDSLDTQELITMGEAGLSEEEAEILYMIEECETVVWLNPEKLNSNVLEYLRNAGARLGQNSTYPISNSTATLLNLYPNPATNNVHIISNTKLENSSIQIFDIKGQRILTQQNDLIKDDLTIDISNLAKGYYNLNIITKDNSHWAPFIKH